MLIAGEDLLFSILAPIYIYIISQLVVPQLTPRERIRLFTGNWFKYYWRTSEIVGLWAPITYILGAYFQGLDLRLVQGALSSTFLILCQGVFERVFGRSNRISLPAFAAVPIFYNTWRMFTLYNWVKADLFQTREINIPSGFAKQWLVLGKCVAVANFAFWAFNLFGILLPVVLPLAWRLYLEAHPHNKTT